jgi:nitrite reductase (NADH) large subunit
VAPLYEMAAVAAKTLAGVEAVFAPLQNATSLKVTGVNVFSAGDFGSRAENEEIILSDPAAKNYKKLVVRDGRLVGAVLFGDTGDGAWYVDLMRSGEPIAPIRDDLAFGRAFAIREAA